MNQIVDPHFGIFDLERLKTKPLCLDSQASLLKWTLPSLRLCLAHCCTLGCASCQNDAPGSPACISKKLHSRKYLPSSPNTPCCSLPEKHASQITTEITYDWELARISASAFPLIKPTTVQAGEMYFWMFVFVLNQLMLICWVICCARVHMYDLTSHRALGLWVAPGGLLNSRLDNSMWSRSRTQTHTLSLTLAYPSPLYPSQDHILGTAL